MSTETKRTGARGASAKDAGKKVAKAADGNGVAGNADAGASKLPNVFGSYAVPAEDAICRTETSLTPGQMLEMYRHLLLTRLVEEKLVNLYRQTKVVGGVFRSLGQEATAVGT